MKAHPLSHALKLFIKNVDENPNIQLKIHTFGFWYWTINFPIITYMFFYQQGLWTRYGLFITLIYSIYANFSTDYAGMSSAQAVINTQDQPVQVKADPFGAGIEIKRKSDEKV